MEPETNQQLEMFSRDWYNEYFRRAASSPTHSRFCEQVYGVDLCQHGLMDSDELDFLSSLIHAGQHVLEIGCSNGFVTEEIHNRTGCSIHGIDYSDTAIEQARERTHHKNGLSFECLDLTRDPLPTGPFDVILSIDSLYFLGDLSDTIRKMLPSLSDEGSLIFSVFQVMGEEDPEESLLPENTWLAQALDKNGLSYSWFDFTENVQRHGILNFTVAEQLKEDFYKEGNGFLYEARAAENHYFKQAAEEQSIVRYIYRTHNKD
jgi:predicted TPR repeat methyltransferase